MRHMMQDLGDLSGLDIALQGREPASTIPGPERRMPRPRAALRVRLALWLGLGAFGNGRCPGRNARPETRCGAVPLA